MLMPSCLQVHPQVNPHIFKTDLLSIPFLSLETVGGSYLLYLILYLRPTFV
jgi:hypothetical protein